MFTCGVSDFSRSDIISPQPKRLRKQLSALINFVKFHEERMELYGRITAARDEYLDRLQVVTQENQQLVAQLEELRQETKVQREEIASLDEAISTTNKQIKEKNQEQAVLRHQVTPRTRERRRAGWVGNEATIASTCTRHRQRLFLLTYCFLLLVFVPFSARGRGRGQGKRSAGGGGLVR